MESLKKYWNFDIEKIFFYFIIFWPIIFSISVLVKIPTVLLTLLCLLTVLLYLWNYDKLKFKQIIIFISIPIIIQFIFVVTGSTFPNRQISSVIDWGKFTIRWTHLILILFVFSIDKIMEKLKEYSLKLVKLILLTSTIVLFLEGIFLFFKSGYEGVWGGQYFKAFFYNTHVNSYFLIALMSSFMFCFFYINKKVEKSICILGVAATLALNLLTGARTSSYIAIAMVGMVAIYMLLQNKKLLIYALILISILIILNLIFNIIDFTQIPLIKKSINVTDNNSSILNGRNFIWSDMYRYFVEHFKFINYVFGIGLAQSMRINSMYISQELWAHNDLIETIIGGGLYSIVLYVYVFILYFIKNKSIIFAFFLFIILFFNGLFVYSELVTAIPIITIVLTMVTSKIILPRVKITTK